MNRNRSDESAAERDPPSGCRFTHEGPVCAVRFRARGVRHTRERMIIGVTALLGVMALFAVLMLQGWTMSALGLFVWCAGTMAMLGLPLSSSLSATPHVLRVGRVERPRADWGRFEIQSSSHEVVLTHLRGIHPREWWAVLPAHEDRVRWFVQQVQAMPVADPGSKEAVPTGLERMVGRKEPE